MVVETEFGKYTKTSRICTICTRSDHMEINALRARDHLTYDEIIAKKPDLTIEALDIHFRNHFIISKVNRQILNLKEENSQESIELVSRILEGDVDLFGALHDMLEVNAQRLHIINERIKKISDDIEIDNTDEMQLQEFVALNRLSDSIENKILKIYEMMHKYIFPKDISKAVMQFQYTTLSKFVNSIIKVLIHFEQNTEYSGLVQNIRAMLSHEISNIETAILKSGGVLKLPDESK